jgi:hypothetical protein
MKTRRLIVVAVLLVVAAIMAWMALISYWQHSQPAFKDAPKLVAAAQAFSRDHALPGQPLPASVTLRDLVSGGYISAEDVRAFDGVEVTIYPAAGNGNPQAILVRARMPDGTRIAVLADGSVQQLPK